jgi:hypothetical protein
MKKSSGNTIPKATKPTMRPAMASGASENMMLMATKPTTRTALATRKARHVASPALVK